mmetsp:Transcript_14390/g.18855  ORF Transcript_14390/g.18855 Transcript_14390/m.18855 type:complete len:82 (+) Transcript_14390:58-303(+)
MCLCLSESFVLCLWVWYLYLIKNCTEKYGTICKSLNTAKECAYPRPPANGLFQQKNFVLDCLFSLPFQKFLTEGELVPIDT